MHFEMTPRGAFSLAVANEFFGGWPTTRTGATALVFPVEGWRSSAVVAMRQRPDAEITADVHGAGESAQQAWSQALAVLSLDVDASDFPAVGLRDPVIGNLQEKYGWLRPVCFHSPYEAAANFIIGARISMWQARAIREAMAQAFGDAIQVEETTFHAFPRPQTLLTLSQIPSISEEKRERLHGIARASLEGKLERAYLRSLPPEQALEELRALRGVGEFTAQGILMRGAGLVDTMTVDEVTPQAIKLAYGLAELPNAVEIARRAELWRPFRLWAEVLLHVWLRREMGGPQRPPRSGSTPGATRMFSAKG